MNEQTRQNLLAAMHGEAFAHAKYLLYAEAADRSGRADLAQVFEEAARAELLEHFCEEADLAGLAGSNADNLRDAIAGEDYEVETMYREFAEQAAAAGEGDAAARFREVRGDEAGHRAAFRAALARIESASASSSVGLAPARKEGEDGSVAIERVCEGMIVIGADGKPIGKVTLIRMGDPEALTTQGEERPGPFFVGHETEPKVPEALRPGLLRMGYLKVERHGVLGIGERDHYVRSDRIAAVSGDRVTLTVTETNLPE